MTAARVLVAGIGNIFFGDDAFGVEVARRLAQRPQPEGVRVVDFGIRGFDLACALVDGYDAAILVDATQQGGPPGTLRVLELDLRQSADSASGELIQTHGLHPAQVFRLVRALGGEPPNVYLVGCEPAFLGSEEEPAMGLSEQVESVVDEAVRMVETLVRDLLARAHPSTTG